jgi:transposase-like protein
MNTRKTYPVEFRTEAVKLVLEQGLSLERAASRLGIPKGTLANWVVAAKAGSDKPAPGARSVAELEAENARLRKELAEARQERDVIKNRPHGSPVALMSRNSGGVHWCTHGLWPLASWWHEPRQKTWPRGSCGPICGGTFG